MSAQRVTSLPYVLFMPNYPPSTTLRAIVGWVSTTFHRKPQAVGGQAPTETSCLHQLPYEGRRSLVRGLTAPVPRRCVCSESLAFLTDLLVKPAANSFTPCCNICSVSEVQLWAEGFTPVQSLRQQSIAVCKCFGKHASYHESPSRSMFATLLQYCGDETFIYSGCTTP
jgi:hypothetical protein